MNCLIATILVISSFSIARASEPPSPVGIELKGAFQFQSEGRSVDVKTSRQIAANNRGWIVLSKPISGVMLLARVASNENRTVKLEYLVVDTENEGAVIASPAIIANLEQRADLRVASGKETIQITALAHQTSQPKR